MSSIADAMTWLGRGRVAVSVPASHADEAFAVWETSEGVALPALVAAGFPNGEALLAEAVRCLEKVPALSIALGGGADVSQWAKVLAAASAGSVHLNQPFTTAAYSKGRFVNAWVNGVVEPTHVPGRVRLTGLSDAMPELEARDAANILLDGQVDALKLHPTDAGEDFSSTVEAARQAADVGLIGFEPAGGLDLQNTPGLVERLAQIPRIRILPHVFGAVLDRSTGNVDLARVRALVTNLREAVGSD